MKRIVLIGASGHGRVCAEIAELNGYDEILFLDDNRELTECGGYSVVGVAAEFEEYLDDDTAFFVSVGNAEIRKRIQEEIETAGGKIATLLHPKSVISKKVEIGAGSAVMACAVINSGTKIGKGVITNTSSSVDHNCTIGDYCHVAVGAHICGTVNIGEKTWIGAGVTVSNDISICGGCIIGVGATVARNIEKKGIYIGVPAKEMIKED